MAIAMNFNYGDGNIHWMDTPGARIKALRLSKIPKITQEDLAVMIDVDQSTISDIENGRGLSAENMMRICDALKTTPQYIMRGKSDAEDLLLQIKNFVTSGTVANTQNYVSEKTPVPEAEENAQYEQTKNKKSRVALVSSQPEPKTPKGANLGTFGGSAQAKPRKSYASNKAARIRK